MHSYTSLKRADQTPRWDVPLEDFKVDLEPPVESADLPGGSQVGIYLHEVLEHLDLASLAEAPNFDAWKNRPDVATLFRDAMNRHQIREQRWFDRGLEIIFKTLSAKMALADGRMVGPLHACPNVREMEFVYPIPESAHPALDRGDEGRWTVERGYLKGFVDFVFEHEGLIYFADWKSDLLDRYDAKSLEEHVIEHYQLQARIYSVGIIRLLRIRNEREYHRRFGGLLYVFLRGINGESVATEGVYFHRPEWAEVCRCEDELSALPGLN